MKVYIGSDHRGFDLKTTLLSFLEENHFEAQDMGALQLVPTDDYVDYSSSVAKAVAYDIQKGIEARGIVICGSGFGVDFTANKINGIRCGIGFEEAQVKHGRTNDDINVLALASMFTDTENAKHMVKIFLETAFSGEERHVRRIEKIRQIELSKS
jgi:ribose 5-phosphate isomerase B